MKNGHTATPTMQRIDKYRHVTKVIALCLPPVIMALTGSFARQGFGRLR
jgi:hypothetical protein